MNARKQRLVTEKNEIRTVETIILRNKIGRSSAFRAIGGNKSKTGCIYPRVGAERVDADRRWGKDTWRFPLKTFNIRLTAASPSMLRSALCSRRRRRRAFACCIRTISQALWQKKDSYANLSSSLKSAMPVMQMRFSTRTSAWHSCCHARLRSIPKMARRSSAPCDLLYLLISIRTRKLKTLRLPSRKRFWKLLTKRNSLDHGEVPCA